MPRASLELGRIRTDQEKEKASKVKILLYFSLLAMKKDLSEIAGCFIRKCMVERKNEVDLTPKLRALAKWAQQFRYYIDLTQP